MTPLKQTLFHDIHGAGNCLETCLASIFEIPIVDVPSLRHTNWFPTLFNWLNSNNHTFQGTLTPPQIPTYSIGINGYFIVAGNSPRGSHIKGGHAVIFKNGIMVHDPHPDNTGILTINYALAIE